MESDKIRNIAIIAHIDHGKSTLADRMLEITGSIDKDHPEQFLDQMGLERERGITIKMQPAQMEYNGYKINLLDTPGHADFSYEVSRALKAIEGVILLVDATTGVQAQTLTNLEFAQEEDLPILPVINKIDLDNAKPEKTENQILSILDEVPEEILKISAKTGEGVESLLDSVTEIFPPPEGNKNENLQGLIFDSLYDNYKGVMLYVRLFKGEAFDEQKCKLLQENVDFEIKEVGKFKPQMEPKDKIEAGDIGYIATGVKDANQIHIGDTVAQEESAEKTKKLKGYKVPQPKVFASIYPIDTDKFPELKQSLKKLSLNDSSLDWQQEKSPRLGRGFRIGVLGSLHLEVIIERLKREHDINIIVTTPTVKYRVNGEKIIHDANELPNKYDYIEEPWTKVQITTSLDHMGDIMNLLNRKRAKNIDNESLDENTLVIKANMPLKELMSGFYDKLQSISSGFASCEYEVEGWEKADLVPLHFLVAEDKIEAFSQIVHKDNGQRKAREGAKKLKDLIPQAQFSIPIQGELDGDIVAREDIPALKKDVTEGLYGGDYSRKKKLIKRQREGKKKMKKFGKVNIPKDVFIDFIKQKE